MTSKPQDLNRRVIELRLQQVRRGKSQLAELWKEAILNNGGKVVVVNPESVTIQRRKKHLTLIKSIHKKQPEMVVIFDELQNKS